jgi:lipoyl(octanoyl) transferase
MNSIEILEPGLIDYQKAWDLQKELLNSIVEAKKRGEEGDMKLLLLEHPHVYTLGMNGDKANMLFNDELLERIGAKFYKIERGGDITYHGFGQLVGYPIIDLERFNIGIKEYIWRLEEAVIRTIAHYGISGSRSEGTVGVWIESEASEPRKICAIGVKVSRFVTMHGFALNVTTDLNYYRHINPCGFTDRGVTSIEVESGQKPTLSEVSAIFKTHFAELFPKT